MTTLGYRTFFTTTRVSWYPDFTGAQDDGDGGDNWSCKSCKTPVESSPSTNQCPAFYWPDAQPTASKHWMEKVSRSTIFLIPSSPVVLQPCLGLQKVPGYLSGRVTKPLVNPLTPATTDNGTETKCK